MRIDFTRIDLVGADFVRIDLVAPNPTKCMFTVWFTKMKSLRQVFSTSKFHSKLQIISVGTSPEMCNEGGEI